jgi:DNA-binding CsgD family transcriptional regulator
MGPIVGREQELADLQAALAARGPRVHVIEGEPGIGKTTIWRAAIEGSGALVLRARPVEAEARLAFGALCDLLGEVAPGALAELPDPQRLALEQALLLTGGDSARPEPKAALIGTLNLLRLLAAERRVVVAVDDVQWLDADSAAAIAYAGRRLTSENVHLLLAMRSGPLPPAFESLLRGEPVTRVRVGPMSLGAVHHIVHTRLGTTLPRPLLRRIHESAGGNPLMALELARAVIAAGEPPAPGEPLPAPDEIRAVVRNRVAGMPRATLDALLAAALLATPTLDVLDEAALAPALDAQLVRHEGGRLAFTHPLFASAVVELASPAVRRVMHRRLAEIVADREQRALHLALAAEGPDADIADALDVAAEHAASRGAPEAAAHLLERAIAMTAPEATDARERRRHEASLHHWVAGDEERAAALLEDALDSLEPGPHRALALSRLGRVRKYAGWLPVAERLDREALAEAGDDLRVRAEAEENTAWTLLMGRADVPRAAHHARAAVELARELDDLELLADALSALSHAEFLLGGGLPSEAIEEALLLEHMTPKARIGSLARMHHGLLLTCADDLTAARREYERTLEDARTRGDEWASTWMLMRLALVEHLAGRWAVARGHVAAGLDVTGRDARWISSIGLLAAGALVDASAGADGARDAAARAVAMADERAAGYALNIALWARGHIELANADPAAAEPHLALLWERARRAAIEDPGERRFAGDLIETWVALDRAGDATEVVEWLEARGRELRRSSALALAARGRGLLAARSGATDDAVGHLERALAEHERTELPFERARTLLALGGVLRRARRNRAAREALGAAGAIMRELGATPWTDRADDELARISGRQPSANGLTPAEARVAALVAEGHSNREVAAALFLSERTVESHLSRVFSKLGVRSRGQLTVRERAKPQ